MQFIFHCQNCLNLEIKYLTLCHQIKRDGFGTAPVFFTAISTILGAILFLRFGYAVGTL
jgi:hypothetical protein